MTGLVLLVYLLGVPVMWIQTAAATLTYIVLELLLAVREFAQKHGTPVAHRFGQILIQFQALTFVAQMYFMVILVFLGMTGCLYRYTIKNSTLL